VRRSLRKMSDSTFVEVMKIFAIGDYCSPVILHALGRTPAIRERMKKVGSFRRRLRTVEASINSDQRDRVRSSPSLKSRFEKSQGTSSAGALRANRDAAAERTEIKLDGQRCSN